MYFDVQLKCVKIRKYFLKDQEAMQEGGGARSPRANTRWRFTNTIVLGLAPWDRLMAVSSVFQSWAHFAANFSKVFQIL
jgi:hypothetical protein